MESRNTFHEEPSRGGRVNQTCSTSVPVRGGGGGVGWGGEKKGGSLFFFYLRSVTLSDSCFILLNNCKRKFFIRSVVILQSLMNFKEIPNFFISIFMRQILKDLT